MADPGERDHWFEDVADHLGAAYLRYSFTKGTRQEIDFLVGELGLEPGMRVLDVGCGPGRHAYELATRGIETHGIDVSRTFVDLAADGAPEGATFERMDARHLVDRDDLDDGGGTGGSRSIPLGGVSAARPAVIPTASASLVRTPTSTSSTS